MAKQNIDLTGKLKMQPQPAVAPVAKPPDQPIRHGPPLKTGTVYATKKAPPGMTQMEYDQLTEVGWTPGTQVTEEMAAAIDAMNADAETSAGPPVDPATPPVQFNPKPIESLSPADQLRHQQEIAAARKNFVPPQDVAQSLVGQKVGKFKRIDVPLTQPERPASSFVPDPDHPRKSKTLKFLDTPQTITTPGDPEPPPPEPLPDPVETVKQEPREPIAPLTHCPHCSHQLNQPDIPEPEHIDKMSFLSTQVLGDGKPYLKEYLLMDGQLKLIFRTLTIAEVDACYQQANADRGTQDVQTQYDWEEKVNRYRLYLQLQRVQSSYLDHDLPDGLSPSRNQNATAFWDAQSDQEKPLLLIEKYIMGKVLPTESMARIAMQTCARFNRLVSKLEAQVDNAPFWKATEEQS